MALTTGPSKRPLKLTFEERKKTSVMGELGAVLLAACQATPDGVVAFLPSYDYEEKVFQTWGTQGWLAKLKVKAVVTEGIQASVFWSLFWRLQRQTVISR
jgi:Rad3-related DNA helicase